MRIITAITAPLAGLALVVTVLAMAATAHTPSGGASCAGVFAQGDGYQSTDTNTLTVTLDGVDHVQPFTTDGRLDVAVPQDGAPHTWAWSVTTTNPNPAYSAHDSGSITCGTPPPPAIKRASIHTVVYCLPYGPHVEGHHGVKSWWWTHRLGAHPVLRAVAKHGHVFPDGKTTLVRHLHQKRTGCHTGS